MAMGDMVTARTSLVRGKGKGKGTVGPRATVMRGGTKMRTEKVGGVMGILKAREEGMGITSNTAMVMDTRLKITDQHPLTLTPRMQVGIQARRRHSTIIPTARAWASPQAADYNDHKAHRAIRVSNHPSEQAG
jgi:hypothetical protein